MKRSKNRSRAERQFLWALQDKWQAARATHKRKGIRSTPHVVAGALGAAAVIGSVDIGLAKEDAATMPEVVVTAAQEQDPGKYTTAYLASPKYTVPLRDVPQTITVVNDTMMKEQGAASLREVLKNVPGISIQAGEGGAPAGDQMTIRGFSARTDMFIDGVRDFGGYSRDPFNFAQVEVSKGPASAYNGRGSTGGSINMVSKDAHPGRAHSGTAGLGTDGYHRYTVDMNEPIPVVPGMAVRMNAMYHTNEVANRDVVSNERWGLAPSVVFGAGTPTRLTLNYVHLDQDNLPDYGVPWMGTANNNQDFPGLSDQPSPAGWSNFYGLKDRDFEEVKTDIVTARAEHDVSDGVSLRNQTRYEQTKRNSIVTSPRFLDLSAAAGDQFGADIRRTDWKYRDQVTSIINNQADVTLKVDTAGVAHTLVPGIEITREDDRNYTGIKTGADSPSTSIYSPNPDDPYLENIQRSGARLQSTVNAVGVYVFDTAAFNEHWELNGGVRYDYFNVDYVSIATTGAYAANLGHIDRALSWRSGLVYKPVEEGSIYFGYGTSFNPSAEGLATTTITDTPTATTNINIRPEKTETYELGTKWELFHRKLSASMAVFHTTKSNARTEDPANPSDILVLQGRQRVEGLELGANGKITDHWDMFAGYTFLLSKVEKSNNPLEVGNQLGNTPRNSLNLWTTYALPRNFEVGGGAQYVGERYSALNNNREAPAYWLGSAMLAYKVNKNVTLRLNVNNIADEEYIESVGGGHFIPGAGRTAMVTSEFKF